MSVFSDLNCVIQCKSIWYAYINHLSHIFRILTTKILFTEWFQLNFRLLLIGNTSFCFLLFFFLKISNISVQVVSTPGKLPGRPVRPVRPVRPGRRPPQKPINKAKLKKELKKKAPFWNVQNKIILFTVFLFILAVIAWTLLWLYISELKSVFLWG